MATAAANNGRPQNGRRPEEGPAPRHVEGVILLDCSLKIVASDEGAAAILSDLPEPPAETDWSLQVLPEELLNVLQNGDLSDPLTRKFRIHLGGNPYLCRIHLAQSRFGGTGHLTVLHLARELSMDDALVQISAEYRLTVREQQALRGVLLGLTSKEVAEQMSISPNTVKAFLRLIMGKMGVSSRTGIVAKLFGPNGHG